MRRRRIRRQRHKSLACPFAPWSAHGLTWLRMRKEGSAPCLFYLTCGTLFGSQLPILKAQGSVLMKHVTCIVYFYIQTCDEDLKVEIRLSKVKTMMKHLGCGYIFIKRGKTIYHDLFGNLGFSLLEGHHSLRERKQL